MLDLTPSSSPEGEGRNSLDSPLRGNDALKTTDKSRFFALLRMTPLATLFFLPIVAAELQEDADVPLPVALGAVEIEIPDGQAPAVF